MAKSEIEVADMQRFPGWIQALWKASPKGAVADGARLTEGDHNLIEVMIRMALIGVLAYWTLIIVSPFAPIIAWSGIMTVAIHPTYVQLAKALRGRHALAAVCLTVLGLLVVVGPVTWLGIDLVEFLGSAIPKLRSSHWLVPKPSESVKDWPILGPQIFDYWTLASANIRSALAPALPQLEPVGAKLLAMAGSAGLGTAEFLVSVVVMGFLLMHDSFLLSSMKTLALKIDRAHGEKYLATAGATIRAVSRGVIGISLLQAVVGGIGMSLAGVPGASLLTLAILILGIVQIGPGVVTTPVMVWAWLSMPPLGAAALTLCMGLVSLSDAFVKPFFLSRGLTTPTVVTFIGVIGGMLSHGIIGLFVGPIIVALAWNLTDAWLHERQLSKA
jgi:predicted PurR-regulated permease PerM